MEGMEVGQYLWVDVMRQRYGESGGVVDRLDFPVVVFCGVCEFWLVGGRTGARGSGEDGRGVQVMDRRDGNGGGRSEIYEHGRDGFVEQGPPVRDHRGMHERSCIRRSVTVGQLLDSFVLVFPRLFHDVEADLLEGRGDDRRGHACMGARGASDGTKGTVISVFIR